mgnify:CR=1 FL=1
MFGRLKQAVSSATTSVKDGVSNATGGMLEVIEWADYHPNTLVKRVPETGPPAALLVVTAGWAGCGLPMCSFRPPAPRKTGAIGGGNPESGFCSSGREKWIPVFFWIGRS